MTRLTIIAEEIAEMLNRDEEEARRPFHISNFLKLNEYPKHSLMFSSTLIEIYLRDSYNLLFEKRKSWSYRIVEKT